MSILLERCNQFLDRPLTLAPRAFLALAAILSGVSATMLGGPGRRSASFLLGAYALLLLRAAVHGKIGALIDVGVLGAYLSLGAVWPGTHFSAGPALWTLLGAAAGLLTAAASAWRAARVQAAEDLRTVG